MKFRAIFVASAIPLLLALLGAAFLAAGARHHAEALLTAALDQQVRLRLDLQRGRQMTARWDEMLAAARRAAAALPAGPAPRVVAVPMANTGKLLAKDPKLAALWVKAQAANFEKNYGPFFRQLNLSAAQSGQLKQILVAQFARHQDIYDTAQQRGLTPKDPAIVALLGQADEQARSDEAGLLGDEGFRALQDYDRTLPVRSSFVEQLAADVAFSDPLSAQQGEQLAQTLANGSPSYQAGGRADFWNGEAVDWPGLEGRVQAILTPLQFAAWRQNRAWLEAQLQTAYHQALKADTATAGSL